MEMRLPGRAPASCPSRESGERGSIDWFMRSGLLAAAAALLVLSACSARSSPKPARPEAAVPSAPPTVSPVPPATSVVAPPEVLPEKFESKQFIVTFARAGDTSESLAARYGSPAAWMIEDYADSRTLTAGQEVVIPRSDWNPPGVFPAGHQLVPILVYHNITAQRKGRLAISASVFEEQMRYLKAEGYRAVSLQDFLEYLQQRRQLPKKSVVLAFDDGHKGFLEYARPVLKELGFAAALFIPTDQISSRPNPSVLSWTELRDLIAEGVEVYAHSKTHQDLRRRPGETESAYARRMQIELSGPLDLLRKHLNRPAGGLEVIAYPYGQWDEDLLRSVKQHGYVAGFTVRRQGNPAFVPLLKINRSQVYADWTLDEFKNNLSVFQPHSVPLPGLSPASAGPPSPPPGTAGAGRRSVREEMAARHNDRSEELESQGSLRQALDERDIALTIMPGDAHAQDRRRQLEDRIEKEVTVHMEEWRRAARRTPAAGDGHLLAALALDPTFRPAFDALRNATPPVRFLTHTVRPQDTVASLADLYYGDRSRADAIEEANGLAPESRLAPGRVLVIPEITGVPFLRPDR